MSAENQGAAMEQAIRQAQESFRFFWRELSWEERRVVPALKIAVVKIAFAVGEDVRESRRAPPFEYLWAGNVQFDGHRVHGRLLNNANFIPHLRKGEEVSVPVSELEDWLYATDDVVCGGFTVQVLRAGMSDVQCREHDAAWGLPFPAPELCNITPYEKPAIEKPKGLSRLWRKPSAPSEPFGMGFEAAFQLANEKEHPMSEAMRGKIVEALNASPDVAQMRLDDGWTMVQRDALAGNLAPVQVLLAHGADGCGAKTPLGDTALDLAKLMGWPRVVAAIGSSA